MRVLLLYKLVNDMKYVNYLISSFVVLANIVAQFIRTH